VTVFTPTDITEVANQLALSAKRGHRARHERFPVNLTFVILENGAVNLSAALSFFACAVIFLRLQIR
jgi:hypothetical protein